MDSIKNGLIPVPKDVRPDGGAVLVPNPLIVVAPYGNDALYGRLLEFQSFIAEALGLTVELTASDNGLASRFRLRVKIEPGASPHPEGYRLEISTQAINVEAVTAQGAAYGLVTLKQLIAVHGRRLPTGAIIDWPDFDRRGVLIDVSRGKVPTMSNLFRFVDLLADLKVNEFQLYMEHTFAYREHPDVWRLVSPFTGEEIMALDRYCRDRFIDLVPCQNSFGHLRKWLVLDRYKHLAEAPDGYTAPSGKRIELPFSLCPTDERVPPFLAGLYDELLPHFSSRYFNVCCDETGDVGRGRSAGAVQERGYHAVYLEHLMNLYRLAKAHHRTIQIWSDMVVHAPEMIPHLPEDIVVLDWGYEADHPFAERCRRFASAGLKFYVCPGTSTWNSIVGRTDNALANMRNAAESGKAHGAVGFLNTIWGDGGHQDYEPVTYLPIAYGAGISWNVADTPAGDIAASVSRHVFRDSAETVGSLLYDLGNLYQALGKGLQNKSLLAQIVFRVGLTHPWERVTGSTPEIIAEITPEKLLEIADRLRHFEERLREVDMKRPDATLIQSELLASIRVLMHACDLGLYRLEAESGQPPHPDRLRQLKRDVEDIIARHRELWLARNRIGGLDEISLAPLHQLRSAYAARLSGDETK